MKEPVALTIPEQLVLLSLRMDNRLFGESQMRELNLAYAILYELLLTGKVRFASTSMPIEVVNADPLGDAVLDDCLQLMASESPRNTTAWMAWISHTALRERIARGLYRKEILRAVERRILFVFKRRTYEIVDHGAVTLMLEKIREAIFGDDDIIDVRLGLVITLAHSERILSQHFKKKDLKSRMTRLARIGRYELLPRTK